MVPGKHTLSSACYTCADARPWALPSDWAVPGYWENLESKVSCPQSQTCPSHSTDFNWPRLLPPTGPSHGQEFRISIERRSVSNPGSHCREFSALPTELRDGRMASEVRDAPSASKAPFGPQSICGPSGPLHKKSWIRL